MLAKFENGYFLEVLYDKEDNAYEFSVYNENGTGIHYGYTEYRDIELYYPMNLIDYILHYCEPDDVQGKYEILSSYDMDDYKDENGAWVLETQGDEDDIRRYLSYESAKGVMEAEYEETLESHSCCMESNLDSHFATIGDEEFYQCWKIYEDVRFDDSVEEKFHEIQMELDRADIGVSQYAFELMDTSVIRDHLWKVEQLLNELKDLIE